MGRSSLILIGVLALFGLYGCNKYNSLTTKTQGVGESWAGVQNQYQRRADLIPNLVNTVKGAADFEQSTLTAVIEARANATSINLKADDLSPENMAKFQAAQDQLSGSLSRLMVSVEQYPNLKANQNFLELQSQLEGTENRINVARNDFNTAVKDYNISAKTFPANIIAGLFGFKEKGFFEAAQGAQNAPEVKF